MNHRISISSLFSRVCAALLALLGFSCSDKNEVMYGTPVGSFEVKGAVINEEGNPIPDAEIRVAEPDEDSGIISAATTETNNEGSYSVSGQTFPQTSLKVVCIPEGNDYKADSITVPVKYVEDKDHKKDGWYEGHATLTADFTLEKKEGAE